MVLVSNSASASCRGHGRMMNFAAIDLASMRGVETISFCEPMFDRASVGEPNLFHRTIVTLKFGVTAITMGGIVDNTISLLRGHMRVKVG